MVACKDALPTIVYLTSVRIRVRLAMLAYVYISVPVTASMPDIVIELFLCVYRPTTHPGRKCKM